MFGRPTLDLQFYRVVSALGGPSCDAGYVGVLHQQVYLHLERCKTTKGLVHNDHKLVLVCNDYKLAFVRNDHKLAHRPERH